MKKFLKDFADSILPSGFRGEKALIVELSKLQENNVSVLFERNQQRSQTWLFATRSALQVQYNRGGGGKANEPVKKHADYIFQSDLSPMMSAEVIHTNTHIPSGVSLLTSSRPKDIKSFAGTLTLFNGMDDREALLQLFRESNRRIELVTKLINGRGRTMFSLESAKAVEKLVGGKDYLIVTADMRLLVPFHEIWVKSGSFNQENALNAALFFPGNDEQLQEFITKMISAPSSEDILVRMVLNGSSAEELLEAAGVPATMLRAITGYTPLLLDFDYSKYCFNDEYLETANKDQRFSMNHLWTVKALME